MGHHGRRYGGGYPRRHGKGGLLDRLLGEDPGGYNDGLRERAAPERIVEIMCQKCGITNPRQASFCMKCGNSMAPPVPNTTPCGGCSIPIPSDAKFCPGCGVKR